MMRIVPQATPPDNQETYRQAVAEARAALERAIAVTLPVDASSRIRSVPCWRRPTTRVGSPCSGRGRRRRRRNPIGCAWTACCTRGITRAPGCITVSVGPLAVRRATYREVGVRNGPTIVPLDLATGLINGATPALVYRVALGYAQGPGRHAEEQLHADHRRPRSRSTLERLSKAIGTQTHRAAPRIEAALRCEETLPAGTHAIVVGLDRTTVPMEEVRPAGAAPTTRRKARTTPYVRTPPAAVDVHYRMAYVGTVSLVDRTGEALVTRRYAIASTVDPTTVTRRLMADLRRARAQAPRLPVGIVQDAAPELWALVRSAFATETRLRRWHEAIDRYHLNERRPYILRLVEPDARRREQQLRRWNAALDTDDRTIDRIARWVVRRTPEHDREVLATLETHWTYLVKNNDRMRYATLRQAGLPCGSGATEGACKSIVTMRTKRSGQRWHEDGVTAALTLRSIYLSDRLPTLWAHFAAEYSADVQAAA